MANSALGGGLPIPGCDEMMKGWLVWIWKIRAYYLKKIRENLKHLVLIEQKYYEPVVNINKKSRRSVTAGFHR